MMEAVLSNTLTLTVAAVALITVWRGIKIVRQSRVYIVERFGRYTRSLQPGLNLIIPFVDRVAHRVNILEQQLDDFKISVVTRDNVEIILVATVFFRITDPHKSVYRIENLEHALYKNTQSLVRAAGGEQELDEIQISRSEMNQKVQQGLELAAEHWGCEITRTEIVDVQMDKTTRESQQKQLEADRNRRATVATAEGDKTAKQLAADAVLYDAKQRAEAIRLTADAEAHAVRVKAAADAEQTQLVGDAIRDHGEPAIRFELGKRQIQAIEAIAGAKSTKTLILPTDVTSTIGSLHTMIDLIGGGRSGVSTTSNLGGAGAWAQGDDAK